MKKEKITEEKITEEKTQKRGGARPGSGPKPGSGEGRKALTRSVTMIQEHWDALDARMQASGRSRGAEIAELLGFTPKGK